MGTGNRTRKKKVIGGNREIGERIEALRNAKNVTQQEMANALYVDRVTVSQWEAGNRDIKTANMVSIAKYFNVSCDYLLGCSRAAAPDDFIQSVVSRYGLTEQTLDILERLAAPLGIDDAERERIIAKQIAVADSCEKARKTPGEEIDLATAQNFIMQSLTSEEETTLFAIMDDEHNKQELRALNEALTAFTGRDGDTYGLQLLSTIYNYCHREYEDVDLPHDGYAGRVFYTLSANMQRNIELHNFNEVLVRLRDKLTGGESEHGK